MPAVSRPQTAKGDLDLLKSLLTSALSDADQRSESRAEDNSPPSGSSSSSDQGLKADDGSQDSQSSFWSDKKSDRTYSIDGGSEEKAGDLETPSYASSVYSEDPDWQEPSPPKPEAKTPAKSVVKKKAKKTKKKVVIKLAEDQDAPRINIGLARQDSKDSEVSLPASKPPPADDGKVNYVYRKRKAKKSSNQQELSDRAKHTLHLYPENLTGPNRLEKNYHELHHMLLNKNKQLVADTKRTLDTNSMRNEGCVGTLKPPVYPGRRQRLWSARSEPPRPSDFDRTEQDYEQDLQCANGQCLHKLEGYYLIDTTDPESQSQVSFVQGGTPGNTLFYKSPRPRIQRPQSGKTPVSGKTQALRGRGPKRTRPQSAYELRNNNANNSSTVPTKKPPVKTSPTRSESDSSPSRSRSRSHSADRRVDHKLSETDNKKLKDWLREKNKLLRRKRREERRIEREKRKAEAEEERQKLQTREKSTVVVEKWMREKKQASRLLKRRPTERDRTISKGEDQVEETTQNIEQEEAKEVKPECTCGFVDLTTSQDEDEKLTLKLRLEKEAERQKRKPKPPSAKKSGSGVKRGGLILRRKEDEEKEEEEKKRLSYNNWLKQKNVEDMERRKQEKLRRSQAESDPETEEVISKVARNRIDNIQRGRKKIETGINSMDSEVNKSLEERAQEKKQHPYRLDKAEEVAPSEGTSVRFYRWNKSPEKKRAESAPVTRKRAVRGKSSSTERNRSISPKPELKSSKAYNSVKYQRRSWDEFSDYVWDKLNTDEEEEEKQSADEEEEDKEESSGSKPNSEEKEEESEERPSSPKHPQSEDDAKDEDTPTPVDIPENKPVERLQEMRRDEEITKGVFFTETEDREDSEEGNDLVNSMDVELDADEQNDVEPDSVFPEPDSEVPQKVDNEAQENEELEVEQEEEELESAATSNSTGTSDLANKANSTLSPQISQVEPEPSVQLDETATSRSTTRVHFSTEVTYIEPSDNESEPEENVRWPGEDDFVTTAGGDKVELKINLEGLEGSEVGENGSEVKGQEESGSDDKVQEENGSEVEEDNESRSGNKG